MKLSPRPMIAIAALAAMLVPPALAAREADQVMLRTGELPTIEVLGERPLTPEEVRKSVRDIFEIRMPFDPIPRFHDDLCLKVAGLGETFDAEVAARIRANATAAGLKTGRPDCKTNALVMVVDRPARLIERLRDEYPQLFTVNANREIDAQLGARRPAIVWSPDGLRNSRGAPMAGTSALPGGQVITANPSVAFQQSDAYFPSRIRVPFSRTKEVSVVVFDVRQLDDVHLVQLADYATVHLLATPRRDVAVTGGEVPTILSLFALGPRAAPAELTALDRAYLKGLYTMEPNGWSSRLAGYALAAYESEAQAGD